MDPTTADFNAWLAEEGAKIGATVPPQPSNLLSMYGTGYVPGDTAYEPTTSDILASAEARNAGFPGFLRRVADTIPESGRHLEPRGQGEGLLSYWKRAADALSVHDMAKGSLGTVANWLQGTPEIGPDTLAPLGLAPMGSLLRHSTDLLKPSVADSAHAKYLEWKHPDERSAVSGQWTPDKFLMEADRMPLNMDFVRDASHPTAKPYDAVHSIANERGTPRDRFRLLSDQSRASVPGTVVNALAEQQKPQGIRAFHASQHSFDRFDASKIGTGEGQQLQGHGLYFWGDEAQSKRFVGPGKFGKHHYEARLDVDPDHLLDYSKPLSEQTDYVKARLEALGVPLKGRPEDIMSALVADPKAASEMLSKGGIPGARYGSGKEQAYVIFDADRARVVSRDGADTSAAAALPERGGPSAVDGEVLESPASIIRRGQQSKHWPENWFTGPGKPAERTQASLLDAARHALEREAAEAWEAVVEPLVAKYGNTPEGKLKAQAEAYALRPDLGDAYQAARREFMEGRKGRPLTPGEMMWEGLDRKPGEAAPTDADLLDTVAREKFFVAGHPDTNRNKISSGEGQPNQALLESGQGGGIGGGPPPLPEGMEGIKGLGIRAFHGSPHDFDKFDSSFNKTGEGVNAYGHGLYFAENEGVARTYKAAGQPAYQDVGVVRRIQEALQEAGGDEKAARELLNTKAMAATNPSDQRQLFDAYNNFDEARKTGRMYEVRINADPESFLDWDKPLSQQSEAVRGAFAKVGPEFLDEAHPYQIRDALEKMGSRRLKDGQPSREMMSEASSVLRDAGIPGIKYLDQGSRAGGEGTRNYVVFDAEKIEILKKYGWVPAGMVGGGMMMTPPDASAGTVVNAQEDYGQRNDGTAKGKGFLGELRRPDGGVSTEISVGVNIGGKEMEIPLLVPTLSQQEIRFLLENDPAPGDIPESIIRKAYDHAVGRVGQGLSPFAD